MNDLRTTFDWKERQAYWLGWNYGYDAAMESAVEVVEDDKTFPDREAVAAYLLARLDDPDDFGPD